MSALVRHYSAAKHFVMWIYRKKNIISCHPALENFHTTEFKL